MKQLLVLAVFNILIGWCLGNTIPTQPTTVPKLLNKWEQMTNETDCSNKSDPICNEIGNMTQTVYDFYENSRPKFYEFLSLVDSIKEPEIFCSQIKNISLEEAGNDLYKKLNKSFGCYKLCVDDKDQILNICRRLLLCKLITKIKKTQSSDVEEKTQVSKPVEGTPVKPVSQPKQETKPTNETQEVNSVNEKPVEPSKGTKSNVVKPIEENTDKLEDEVIKQPEQQDYDYAAKADEEDPLQDDVMPNVDDKNKKSTISSTSNVKPDIGGQVSSFQDKITLANPMSDMEEEDDTNVPVVPVRVVNNKFTDAEDSHFFLYFISSITVFTFGYIGFYNKNKIIAFALEGRKSRNRRRPDTRGYSKVDTNLEETFTSNNVSNSRPTVIF